MRNLLLLTLLGYALTTTNVLAQDIVFNNKFEFKDGIYLSYDEFINNTPSYNIEKVQVKEKDTHFFNKKKIKSIKYRDKYGKKQKIDIKDVWGICINKVPYIQYQIQQTKTRNSIGLIKRVYTYNGDFTRIRILGNICHFNIEDIFTHPSDGYFDGSGMADTKLVSVQKILKVETGEVRDFTPINLKDFIKDDSALYKHYIENDEERDQKIFLYLQKYNERNPYTLVAK